MGEYYADGQQVTGEWFGLGTDQLGLKGKVGEAEFLRACEGLHPKTGKRLTQRMNINRHDDEGRTVANRRVFYDFTISPPKSVSVMALWSDDRILGCILRQYQRGYIREEGTRKLTSQEVLRCE